VFHHLRATPTPPKKLAAQTGRPIFSA